MKPMKAGDCISQLELKEKLHYNPISGDFTWLVSDSNMVNIGTIAGSEAPVGYIVIAIKKQGYKAHRLAWFYVHGVWPKEQIDHINHIRTDNRFSNLREVSRRENSKNQKKYNTNTSGVTGVYWDKATEKWEARITVDRKQFYLCRSDDKFEAICARLSAERKHNFHDNHGRNIDGS